MGLVNFKDIDFNKSIDKNLKTFEFNGIEIGVVPYLSISDKYDLVTDVLKKSFEKGYYNRVKIDMYFNLFIVYMYTNIQINNEDREDEFKLYDTLLRSGLIEEVKKHIDENEIEDLYAYIFEMEDILMNYKNSFKCALEEILEQIPSVLDKANKMLSNFDEEKLERLKKLKDNIDLS